MHFPRSASQSHFSKQKYSCHCHALDLSANLRQILVVNPTLRVAFHKIGAQMFLQSWRNHSSFLFLIKAFRICSVPVFRLLVVKISGFIVAWVTGRTSAINKRALGFGRPSRKECSHDAARMSLIGASSFPSIFTFQITPRNTSTI